jgi:hypothetical protein
MRRAKYTINSMLNLWLRFGAALSVFLTLSLLVGSIWNVKFRVDTLDKQFIELKEQFTELKGQFTELQKTLVNLDKNVAVGFEGVTKLMLNVSEGVNNAQRVAIRAESMVIDHNVAKDFQDNVGQQKPLMGK